MRTITLNDGRVVDALPPCRSAELIQVIRTVALDGRGTDDDPCREVTQYWSPCGELLATVDPYDAGKKES